MDRRAAHTEVCDFCSNFNSELELRTIYVLFYPPQNLIKIKKFSTSLFCSFVFIAHSSEVGYCIQYRYSKAFSSLRNIIFFTNISEKIKVS